MSTEALNDNEALLRKVIPAKEVVDLAVLPNPLNNEIGFKNSVKSLCKGERLPTVFPAVADFLKINDPRPENKWNSLTISEDAKDLQLKLPEPLFDSDTYDSNPEIRGPMEELILAYEKERVLQGFSNNKLAGTGWSESFTKRFEEVQKPLISDYELYMDLENDGENDVNEAIRTLVK